MCLQVISFTYEGKRLQHRGLRLVCTEHISPAPIKSSLMHQTSYLQMGLIFWWLALMSLWSMLMILMRVSGDGLMVTESKWNWQRRKEAPIMLLDYRVAWSTKSASTRKSIWQMTSCQRIGHTQTHTHKPRCVCVCVCMNDSAIIGNMSG